MRSSRCPWSDGCSLDYEFRCQRVGTPDRGQSVTSGRGVRGGAGSARTAPALSFNANQSLIRHLLDSLVGRC